MVRDMKNLVTEIYLLGNTKKDGLMEEENGFGRILVKHMRVNGFKEWDMALGFGLIKLRMEKLIQRIIQER